tara:strand:+ start:496 stop:687 length:192 start_codon:yes stop_codon:yes gene_type:complete
MTDFLTTSEVAKLAGVSSRTIRNWSDQGKIKAERTDGGHRRFDRAEIEKLIKHRSTPQDGISY